MSAPIRVLMIEDNPADARLLAEMVGDMGAEGLDCELVWSETLESGRQRLDANEVDVVLLDLGLPGSNGLPTLHRLLADGPCRAALVIFSGQGDEELALQALQAGAQDYLVKGQIDAPALARTIRRAIGRAQADHAKSRFLAGISHELRAPLNGILGFAQLMQLDDTLSDRHRRSAGLIRNSGEHLLRLINDILDLAKDEAGRLELDPRPFELEPLVQIVTSIARVKAAQKPGLALQVELAPELPRQMHGDDQRLRQVLLNLLDNAVKFTEAGAVTLRLRAATPGRLCCEVDDTGPGLTDEQRARLFQPFEQVGERLQRCQGTGLGLVISRQLVRLMGGELRASAREGGGNRFAFEVDLAPVAA
ncbi:response regulator [Aquincola sp. S2]|uniref:histidine kinase n=1 Tax=Pseudaquabacterium terrae TaxID=2732868 RepID=A0ABX2EGH8_9BURK|nr:hybrid sensor histidine kinase/response regulator [Aquabacterium terrae]NRF67739.1 response regulator [Aquabacterium terrae]